MNLIIVNLLEFFFFHTKKNLKRSSVLSFFIRVRSFLFCGPLNVEPKPMHAYVHCELDLVIPK